MSRFEENAGRRTAPSARDAGSAMGPASGVEQATVRAALAEERAATLERLAHLTDDFDRVVDASRDSNADDEHDPEGATIAYERSQVDALIQQARTHLTEIEGALARLDAGTYGSCERCGQPIAAARLEARPTARTCVTCPR